MSDQQARLHECALYMKNRKLFPFGLFVEWLERSSRRVEYREVAVGYHTPEGVYVFSRNQKWTPKSLRGLFDSVKLERMDIGDIRPQGLHEFCLDLDIGGHLDPWRDCCVGDEFCDFCWRRLAKGTKLLFDVLVEDFGYPEHTILCCFSGRRGFHLRVNHPLFLGTAPPPTECYTYEVPKKIVSYLSPPERVVSCFHPVFRRVEGEEGLESLFARLFDRSIAPRDGKLRPRFLATVALGSRRQAGGLALHALNRLDPESTTKWDDFRATFLLTEDRLGTMENLLRFVVVQFMWPRLDKNACGNSKHLLRSPLSMHLGSGLLCQPLKADELESFVPARDAVAVHRLFGESEVAEGERKKLKHSISCFRQFVNSYPSQSTEEEEKEKEKTNTGEGLF